MKIKYIEYGVAYRMPDGEIQLNRRLQDHPQILAEEIAHERGHDPGERSTFRDLVLDLTRIPSLDLTLWFIGTPSAWTAILPARVQDGTIWINDTLAILWILAIPAAAYLVSRLV